MGKRGMSPVGRYTLGALVAMAVAVGLAGPSPAAQNFPGASGLPVPRFVSLKSDRVNLRKGPGTDYPTAWVYRRAGRPAAVVTEFERQSRAPAHPPGRYCRL